MLNFEDTNFSSKSFDKFNFFCSTLFVSFVFCSKLDNKALLILVGRLGLLVVFLLISEFSFLNLLLNKIVRRLAIFFIIFCFLILRWELSASDSLDSNKKYIMKYRLP